ncbi:MAG: phosphotransferase [Alphaproteobacteria bacterium]
MNQNIAAFLAEHGWPEAQARPFPADWSARRYARLTRAGQELASAVLMQAEPNADFFGFIRVAGILRGLGASAPEIYAADTAQGFLLLEDFGERNFGRMIDGGADAVPLLRRGVEALAEVQRRFAVPENAGDLPRYDTARFIDLLSPLIENFPHADPAAARAALAEAWTKILAPVGAQPQSLMLRDFIADNLMDLPSRAGWKSVGLLDFELAGIGPIAYDVASLTEQVRRDLPEEARNKIVAHYLALRPELDKEEFMASVAVMSAQRHARIFARLYKMNKPEFLERSHSHLRRLLALPELAPARGWFKNFLPDYFPPLAPKFATPSKKQIPHTAIVLAAGYGRRMMPLTATTPKPLLTVGGKAMLDHAIDRLRQAGVERIVVNAGYLGEQIAEHLARRDPDIIVSREAEPLETGGGVKHALPYLGSDPVYVVNADLPWQDSALPALENLRLYWDAAKQDILLLVMQKERALGFGGPGLEVRGDFDVMPDGQLRRHHHEPPYSHVFIGAQIVKPQLYQAVEAEIFSNNILFDRAEASGRLHGCVHDGGCYHVGTPEDLRRANELLSSGQGWVLKP